MKILLAGSAGQLGREFIHQLAGGSHQFIAPDKRVFDVGDEAIVRRIVAETKPSVLINCAAYNHVDAAEDDYETAYRINALGVRNLAVAAQEQACFFVTYGTDYVFDGKKGSPYLESDTPNPLNNYGRSKLAGEQLLRDTMDNFLLMRVSWVFGLGTRNFLHKLLKWAEGMNELSVVTEEISVPTYTATIVDHTLRALKKGLRGLYHFTSTGYGSRFEVAQHLFTQLHRNILLTPAPASAFPTKARRPRFSVMDNSRFVRDVGRDIPAWQDEISRFIRRLRESGQALE